MRILVATLMVVASLFLYLPSLCHAGNYEIDGYILSMLQATQKDNTLKVSGRITKGQKCKRLKVDIFLESEDGHNAHVICTVNKVGGFTKRLLSGTTTVYNDDTDWEVSDIYVKCISN
jgi:hypothetical protein